jgi:hypothetical protein
MQDARYFRERAEQCLEIARQMSGAMAVDGLRKLAAEYAAHAEKMESAGADAASSPMLAKSRE